MRGAPGRGSSSLIRLVLGLVVCTAPPLLGGGCTPVPKYPYRSEPDPRTLDYVLGPSDTVRINVWKNAELSTDAIVRPDGTITLPLVGDIAAVGKTTKELRDEVVKRLGTYLRAEETPVTVALTAVNSYRFTVSGNVEHGGAFSPKYYVTISDAIAMSGGLNKFANGDKIVIIRSGGGKTRRIPIVYSLLQSGTRPDMDLVLLSGDTVMVP
jgi:polysaccharide biosynthesis/export protein